MQFYLDSNIKKWVASVLGTGYQLTLMKEPSADVSCINSLIEDKINGAKLKSSYSAQVTYTLPQETAADFHNLFLALENSKSVLGIKGVGIACTTMEEVFLK